MLNIKLRKSVSPLISVILLIVVAVIITAIVLTWGKSFTTTSISKVSSFTEADSAIYMLKFDSLSHGKLFLKNISPAGTDPVVITGYSVISPTTHRLLNHLNYLDNDITLVPGSMNFVDITEPPEKEFYVNIYTDKNQYIKLSNVKNSKPVEPFSKIFDGSGNDYGYSVEQTTDGGYIITGYTKNGSNYDVLLIKTDSEGKEDWNKTFDGAGNYDLGYSVQQTTDGGYIITANTYNGSNFDVWLIKTDSSGNEEWYKTFDGGYDDHGSSVQQTTDGGYIITGYTNNGSDDDFWLIKTDSSGNEEWNKSFDGAKYDEGNSVCQTTDGGYIITGNINNDSDDIWLIKTDSSGNEDWNKTFDSGSYDYGYSVQQTTDGGYIILGSTSYGDFWLIKTDSSGNEDWSKTYGVDSEEGYMYSVDKTSDGGYILAGTLWLPDLDEMYYANLLKVDSEGNKEWDQNFYAYPSYYGSLYFYSVEQTTDGGYVVTGSLNNGSNDDVWLIKTDSLGQVNNSVLNSVGVTNVNPT